VLDLGFAKINDRQYVLVAVGTFLQNWDFRDRNFQKWDFDVREFRHLRFLSFDFGTNRESTILSPDEIEYGLTVQVDAIKLNADVVEHGLTVKG
jgi:hypothetical protein